MRKIFPFVYILSTTFFIYAVSPATLKTFFNNSEIKRVKEDNEIITRMYLKNNATNENTDLKIEIPRTKFSDEDFSIYEMVTDEKAFFPYKISDKNSKLKFYNILTAYSKLTGMNYYSRRIHQPQQLILDSYMVESATNKKRLPDPVYTEIAKKTVNHFIQEDNKFGKLTFRSELYNEGNNFILINTCTVPVAKFIFSISKKEEYKLISYFFYDEKAEGFYYYSANIMRIRLKMVLTENDVLTLHPTTFSNRIRGATVHLAKLLELNWDNKLNPWDEEMLLQGKYKNY